MPGNWLGAVQRSFRFAGAGIRWAWRSQRNFRIQAVAAVAVIAAGVGFQIAAWEWYALVLSMGLVGMAELLNTALETLCDRVTRERDAAIRRAKDAAAGGVLLAALAAFTVGLIIFLRRIWPE